MSENTTSSNIPEVEISALVERITARQQVLEKITTKQESFEKDLKRSRDQIDDLQIQTNREKMPWYKRASNIFSILALIVSVGMGTYTVDTTVNTELQSRQIEFIKDKREELRSTLNELIDERRKTLELTQKIQSNIRNNEDILINSKRQLLIEDARNILSELGDSASINSLLYLGYEIALDSDFKEAERILNMAYHRVKSEDFGNNLIKIVTFRSLANLYLAINSPLYNIERGRQYWRKAISCSKSSMDDYALMTTGYSYYTWSSNELNSGNIERSNELIDSAEFYYHKMNPINPARGQQLILVSQAREFIKNPINTDISGISAQLLGEWEIGYPNVPTQKGRAFIQLGDQKLGSFQVTMEIFDEENAMLIRKYFGTATFSNLNTIQINWQGQATKFQNSDFTPALSQNFGMTDNFGNYPVSINGTTILQVDAQKGLILKGKEHILGQGSYHVSFGRVKK